MALKCTAGHCIFPLHALKVKRKLNKKIISLKNHFGEAVKINFIF